MTKQEWDALRYPVEFHQLTDEEGGGWIAFYPMLGQATCIADGNTLDEAYASLESLRRDIFDVIIKSGKPIPIPPEITDSGNQPSGKIALRILPRLHAELQDAAKSQNVSMNAYLNHCIERGHALIAIDTAKRELISSVRDLIDAADFAKSKFPKEALR